METVLVIPLNSKSVKHLTSDLSQWMLWLSNKLLMLLNHVNFYVLFSEIINFYGKLNKLMKWTVYRHAVASVAHPIGFIWYIYIIYNIYNWNMYELSWLDYSISIAVLECCLWQGFHVLYDEPWELKELPLNIIWYCISVFLTIYA